MLEEKIIYYLKIEKYTDKSIKFTKVETKYENSFPISNKLLQFVNSGHNFISYSNGFFKNLFPGDFRSELQGYNINIFLDSSEEGIMFLNLPQENIDEILLSIKDYFQNYVYNTLIFRENFSPSNDHSNCGYHNESKVSSLNYNSWSNWKVL
jgi:hypothetical protein